MSIESWLHRAIWRHLPRGGRRRLLLTLTACLVPALRAPRPGMSLPIFVVGFLRSASGLGEGARLCLDALRAAGIPSFGIDLSDQFVQSGLSVDYRADPAPSRRGPGTIILHVNPPLVPLALFRLGRRCVAGKRIIGHWAWELPQLPVEWRRDFRHVDEVWVPSAFTASAVRAARPDCPVRIVRYPVVRRGKIDMSHVRPPGVDMLALVMFNFHSGFVRKNPLAAISAFAAAFGDDPRVGLLVKSVGAADYPDERAQLRAAAAGMRNVSFHDDVMSADETDGLVEAADVVISLHRSEGFGLVVAEAMLHGKAVVATDWSGSVDFLDAHNGCPVGYRLVPARDPHGTYDYPDQLWADPDIGEAAAMLRRLRDPALRAALGKQAATDAAALFAPREYAAIVGGGIDERHAQPIASTTES